MNESASQANQWRLHYKLCAQSVEDISICLLYRVHRPQSRRLDECDSLIHSFRARVEQDSDTEAK